MGYLFNEHVHHDFSPFKTCVAEGVAMILAVFLILCLFGGPLLAANDFSGDESCMALWRFENGALTTDSSGNSNTLTSRYNPVADTSNYMEGAASVDLEYGDHDNYDIADASLSAGFPFKSGGTGTKDLPYATIGKARDILTGTTGNTVYIRGGTYRITEAITFDSGDSGRCMGSYEGQTGLSG